VISPKEARLCGRVAAAPQSREFDTWVAITQR
jgi:hypothetical protein